MTQVEAELGRLKRAISTLQIGIWEYDFLHENFSANDVLLTWLSRPSPRFDDLLGLVSKDQREGLIQQILQALEEKSTFQFECHLTLDGQKRWFTVTGDFTTDGQDQAVNAFGTVREITEQKNREEKFREGISYRDEFLAIASHELKTPLTSLKLQSQIFIRGMNRQDSSAITPERIGRFVEQADRQVGRMVQLVDDMLDISRIRTGKLTLNRGRLQLGQLIRETLTRLGPSLQMTYGQTPGLNLETEGEIHGDRFRLEQVLTNLLINAFRYGDQKPVEVSLRGDGAAFLLSVRDYGIGIAPEHHEWIFERFKRAIPASEVSGLGLGLYIARQVVQAHGGRIWVESALAEGAKFNIRLPKFES